MMRYTFSESEDHSNDLVTVILNGKSYSRSRAQIPARFDELYRAIKAQDTSKVEEILNPARGIHNWSRGHFKFEDGSLSYENEEIEPDIQQRILQMAVRGEDPRPIMRFFERMRKNTSFMVRMRLYKFLDRRGLPILPDGTFVAYKGVEHDYRDCHSKTFVNKPGAHFFMPRHKVSDDPSVHCSDGFHAGSKNYAASYGKRSVIVKIDPAAVVCIPSDSAEKLRLHEYWVLANAGEQLPDTLWDDEAEWGWDDADVPDFEGPDANAGGPVHEEPQNETAQEEPTHAPVRLYDTELVSVTGNAIPVIKAVREITGFALKEAKSVVDRVLSGQSVIVADGMTQFRARKARALLVESGAEARVVKQTFSVKAEVEEPEVVSTPEALAEVETPRAPNAKPSPPFETIDNFTKEQLLNDVNAHWLRKYASGHLKIVGASKLKGGLPALVDLIMKVREAEVPRK